MTYAGKNALFLSISYSHKHLKVSKLRVEKESFIDLNKK